VRVRERKLRIESLEPREAPSGLMAGLLGAGVAAGAISGSPLKEGTSEMNKGTGSSGAQLQRACPPYSTGSAASLSPGENRALTAIDSAPSSSSPGPVLAASPQDDPLSDILRATNMLIGKRGTGTSSTPSQSPFFQSGESFAFMASTQVGSSPGESTSTGSVVSNSDATPSAAPSTGTITDLFDALSASNAKKTPASKPPKAKPVKPGAETPIEPIVIDDDPSIDDLPIMMSMSGGSGGTATVMFSGGGTTHEPGGTAEFAEFSVLRSEGDTSSSLEVTLGVNPNATDGASLSDYVLEWEDEAMSGRSSVSIDANNQFSLTFDADETSLYLYVTPTDDSEVEDIEKVVFNVVDDTTTSPPLYVGDEYDGTTTVDIIDDVFTVEWQAHSGNRSLDANLNDCGGERFFPEKESPTDMNTTIQWVNLNVERVAGSGVTKAYVRMLDPENEKTDASNTGNMRYRVEGTSSFTEMNGVLEVPFADGIDSVTVECTFEDLIDTEGFEDVDIPDFRIGDNYIAVVDASSDVVTGAKLGEDASDRYDIFYADDEACTGLELNQAELLTVWRTLWMELDVMAAPSPPTSATDGPNQDGIEDGFDWSNRGRYDDHDNDSNTPDTWGGEWGTLPTGETEPPNWDEVAQPSKPDISVAQTALEAACIELKEIDQENSTGKTPQEWSDYTDAWITGEHEDNQTSGDWDTETPFLREMVSKEYEDSRDVIRPCRDVSANSYEFWVIHATGASDVWPLEQGDVDDLRTCGVAKSDETFILVFNETIRDHVANVSNANTRLDIEQAVAFHEILHCFMFADYDPDNIHHTQESLEVSGAIMSDDWYLASSSDEWKTFIECQVKFIQQVSRPS
jgi:hypothetical protein